jgi:hypothetical protein
VKKSVFFLGSILMIILAFADACSSSRISYSWKKQNSAQSYRNILVIAVVRHDNHALRSDMETHLVEDLISRGVKANSALQTLGPKALEGKTEEAVLEYLNQPTLDALLTIVLLNKKKERYYVPGRVYYSPYGVYHRHFWGYYHAVYDRIYEPGYYAQNTEYFWESNLYDANTKELIYSVQTKSFDPSSTERLAHEYGKLITQDMKENALIP